jgi:hypothetical protein
MSMMTENLNQRDTTNMMKWSLKGVEGVPLTMSSVCLEYLKPLQDYVATYANKVSHQI